MAKGKDDLLNGTKATETIKGDGDTGDPGDAAPASAEGEDLKASDAGADINATRKILARQDKRVIMIPSSEKDKDAVPVGINGYVYNIPRDKWVEVPDSVCEVLENASITAYTQKKREEGEGNELIATDVRRFPFQSKV